MECDSDSGDEYSYEEEEEETDTSDTDLSDISDEAIEAKCIDGWTYVIDPFSDHRKTPLNEFQYGVEISPAVLLSNAKSPVDYFEIFFEKVIPHLCKWTNERADMYFEEIDYKTFKVHGLKWRPVEEGEMYVFFSYVFLMGLVKLPELVDYWSNSIFCSGPKIFSSQIMSRNRFLSILKFLRFSSPKAYIKGKPLTRLAQYFAYVREVCQVVVDPGEHLAIDECLMLYKGKLHFRQYIKDKRSRFGLKLFCVCPSDEQFQGYTWNFSLYTGKDIYDIPLYSDSSNLPVSERIVVFLAQNLLDEGRHIIVDNWYLSTRLTQYLLKYRTYITGTLRTNRGVPQHLIDEPLNKGSSLFIRNEDMLLVRFSDKKNVYVLTSRYEASLCEKKRYLVGGQSQFYYKPLHIEMYNQFMGSVDKTDQMLQPYNPARKSYTWFKKVGIHVASRMLLNAFILHKHCQSENMRFKNFIISCCRGILEKYSEDYRKSFGEHAEKSKISTRQTSSLDNLHQLVQIPSNNRKRRPQKRCRVCWTEGKRKDTRLMCSGCIELPGLCSANHFDEYHNNL